MAHAYVVTSATYIPGSSSDPVVTVVGSVDGIPVTVQVWLSAVQQAEAISMAALKNFISPIMLAQAQANQPPAPTPAAQLPTGSWSQ